MRRSRNPRSCVACRRERPPREMLRVVRLPEGEVVLDERGRQSGRGAYVCPEPQCVLLCLKKKLLEKALKSSVPEAVRVRLKELAHVDVADERLAEKKIAEEAVAALGIARRAGELIIGQDRVLGRLSAGEELFVLVTEDVSVALTRSLSIREAHPRTLHGVNGLELGRALGLRQAKIVALPAKSGFAEKLKEQFPEEGGTAVE